MALQVKQGSFSLNNATGNQVVSWATGGNWPSSATPKLVLFLATGQTADGTAQHGIGMLGAAASSTQRWVLSQASDDAAAAVNSGQSARTNACIVLLSNGTPTVQAVADFVSFGAEQFTINVTTAPGVTGIQIGYIAFGGADITNVAVGSSTIPTVTGNQTISPAGFTGVTPDCLLTAVPYQPASPTESVHSHFGLGWATRLPSIAQGAAWMMEADGSAAIDTQRGFLANCCVGGAEAAITGHARGSLDSFGSGTAVVNWLDAAAAANNIWLYVVIAGGGWQAFSDTEATTNTGKATAVSGFGANTPKGLLMIGSNGTADTASTDTANGECLIALGASDGTTEFAVANIQVNGSGNTANSLAKRRLAATKALSLVKTPTTASPWATVCGEADATFQAGQVTLTWTGTDGTARKFLGLAVGDTLPAGGGGFATITPVGTATTVSNTVATATLSIPKDAALADGDCLVASLTINNSTVSAAPSGWTLIGSETTQITKVYGYVRYVASAAGEPATYDWTLAASVTNGGGIQRYSGVDPTTPQDVAAAVASVGTGATLTIGSITTVTDGAMLVSGVGDDSSTADTFAVPSGWNAARFLTSGRRATLADLPQATHGATGSIAWTQTPTTTIAFAGWFGALRPAPAGGAGTQTLAIAGVGSGERGGASAAIPGSVAVALAAALSAETSGQPATLPAYTAAFAGAGTAEAAGQPALSTAYATALSGAASGERAGQPTALPGVVALSPAGAASGEAVGRSTVAILTALALAGAASTEAAGVPTLLPGAVTAALAGVGSGELAGQPAVGVFTIVVLAGAGSGERAGQPAALPGGLTLPLVGAGSGEVAGQPATFATGAPATLALVGAASAERAGATLTLPGVVLLTPAGAGSAERAGLATLLPGGLVLPLAGVGSGEQRGTLALSTLVALGLAGTGSGERAGVGLVLPGAITLALAGAASGELAGVLTIGGVAIPFYHFVAPAEALGGAGAAGVYVFVGKAQGQGG